jgi:PPK2 family polyphosphate:nucleotide phosphotransferase
VKSYLIRPKSKLRLKSFSTTGVTDIAKNRDAATARLAELKLEIHELHRRFMAWQKRKLLVVLQAVDAGGKDGTVRQVFAGMDPAGIRVVSFKAPTKEELSHDFLWRVHKELPASGEVVVFNRSHYEDILTVQVKNLFPPTIWRKRYQHILNFEQMLMDEGTVILKIFLHISQEEQTMRIDERIQNPRKQWKLTAEDLSDRSLWSKNQAAYEDVLSATSTTAAPWYVVPADRKWYRNVIVAELIRDTLKKLKPTWPDPVVTGLPKVPKKSPAKKQKAPTVVKKSKT